MTEMQVAIDGLALSKSIEDRKFWLERYNKSLRDAVEPDAVIMKDATVVEVIDGNEHTARAIVKLNDTGKKLIRDFARDEITLSIGQNVQIEVEV